MEERHRRLLVKQNPWWQNEKPEVPKFKRDMFAELMKYLSYKQVIAVVGLRRVGKTVLMKQIIQKLDAPKNNICYISFDDIDFQKYEIAEDLVNYFLEFSDKGKKRFLFLDEVQKLPNWADFLKMLYDTERNLKIFVSGSASLEIKKHKETLAGRILTFHIPVLAFREFARYFGMENLISKKNLFREYDLKFSNRKEKYENLLNKYIVKGAFPELLEVDDEEFIKKYVKESVIEKAISDISKIAGADEKIIYELFRLLASNSAQLFEINNISEILKINRNLVSLYIGLLEKSFLIKVSYNYTASVAKQVRANKKQYSSHSSVVIAVMDYPFEAIKTEISGRFVEGIIANSLSKISFWRTPQKEEVDIITDDKFPIEVKYQPQITGGDLKSLIKFCEKFKVKNGMVVTKNLLEKKVVGDVEILLVPAWVFLLLG